MIHSLIRMAEDGSPEGRRDLLRAITDLYLPEPHPSAPLKDHYGFIASHALKSLTDQDRAAYAGWVAAEVTLPRAVAWTLATDPLIVVAHPILRYSPVLTDDDLAALALTQSHEHRISIATRSMLTPMITDVLAEHGNLKVLRQVSGNPGAQFSDPGITRLMARAGQDADVINNLAQRALKRSERQAGRVPQPAPAAKRGESARPALRPHHEVDALIADIMAGRRVLEDVVQMLIERDQAFELAAVLGAFARQQARQVLAAMLKPEAEDIARLCQSINLASHAFEALLALRAKRLALTPPQVAREQHRYGLGTELVQETTGSGQGHPIAAMADRTHGR